MVEELAGLRVFIATPGGLDDVRKSFYEKLIRFNQDDAHERGVTFIPVGWELSLAGKGRPQQIINEEVRRCDYMILVLSDRWGTPPSTDGPYTSGTEEEYNVARDCIENPDAPMRNIAVMFKGVDPQRLTDPGEQLQKVLQFKEQLEAERWLLFSTFDTLSEFEDDLLAHLLRWVREEEKGTHAPIAAPPPPDRAVVTEPSVEGSAEDEGLLDQAKRLTKEGKLTRAESLYARAVLGGPDIEALTQYTRFLRRTGRLDMAIAMAERLLQVAEAQGDASAQIEALSNQAIINRKRGDYAASTAGFQRAMELARQQGDDGVANVAFLLDNLALTLRKEGQFGPALENFEAALAIRQDGDDRRGLANSLNNVGALRRQRGDFAEAVALHQQAVELFVELEDQRGEAQARANLGEAFQALRQYDEARSEYEHSLELNEALKSPEGIGMNCWQLGRLALEEGDVPRALSYAIRCIRSDEGADRPESIGGALHLFGQIDLAAGNTETAIGSLDRSLRIYRKSGQRLGAAWTAADLAVAHAAAGHDDLAEAVLGYALEQGQGLEHAQLQQALRAAREAVQSSLTR